MKNFSRQQNSLFITSFKQNLFLLGLKIEKKSALLNFFWIKPKKLVETPHIIIFGKSYEDGIFFTNTISRC